MAGSGPVAAAQVAPTVLPIIPYPNWLSLLPPQYLGLVKKFATYSAVFTGSNVLSASLTLTVPVQLNNDSDFCALAINAMVTSTDSTTLFTYQPITIQVTDARSNTNLFTQAELLQNVAPSAATPFYLPYPYVFDGGSVIQTTLVNLISTTNFNVYVSYKGFKIYPTPMQHITSG